MTATTQTASEPTVFIERRFDFPRELVFDAWTKPEQFAKWFAPRGCTIRFERFDVRQGGGFHSCLHNPNFGDCWTVGVYQEVTRPSRISFLFRIADATGNFVTSVSQGHDAEWPEETLVAVDFIEVPGGTIVRLSQNVSAALAKRTGAHAGWVEMFDVLGEHLARA